jgi:SpoU rRNA methylase family enzyme
MEKVAMRCGIQTVVMVDKDFNPTSVLVFSDLDLSADVFHALAVAALTDRFSTDKKLEPKDNVDRSKAAFAVVD